MTRDYGKLAAYLAERFAMPFRWGRHGNDCASFAAGAVMAQTGRYPFPRCRWETEKGAQRILTHEGGLEAAVDRRLRIIALAEAHRGDVALVRNAVGPDGFGLAIVDGMMVIGPGERGIEARPIGAALKFWSADE